MYLCVTRPLIHPSPGQEMERVAQETMDKAVTYQNELENQKLSGQKQVKTVGACRGAGEEGVNRTAVPAWTATCVVILVQFWK